MWAPNVIPRELQGSDLDFPKLYVSRTRHRGDVSGTRDRARTTVTESPESPESPDTAVCVGRIYCNSSSRRVRRAEMDWRWTLLTLLLPNLRLTHGSPSSYDLFQGSAYTGAVHRHRNR